VGNDIDSMLTKEGAQGKVHPDDDDKQGSMTRSSSTQSFVESEAGASDISGSDFGSEASNLNDKRQQLDEEDEEETSGKRKKRISSEEAYRRRQALRNGAVPIEGDLKPKPYYTIL
jgi:hypothetical protein